MSFKVDGFSELNKKLNTLDVKTGVSLLQKSGKAAMKPVFQYQKQHAKKDTGDLSDAIQLSARKVSKTSSNRVVVVSVGPTRKSVGLGDNKRKLSNVNQKAIAQEYGNVKTKAEPFIRPSLDVNQRTVINTLISEFKRLFSGI